MLCILVRMIARLLVYRALPWFLLMRGSHAGVGAATDGPQLSALPKVPPVRLSGAVVAEGYDAPSGGAAACSSCC